MERATSLSDEFTTLSPETVESSQFGSKKIIHPCDGAGVLLDDRHFQLEDVDRLAQTLMRHAEGKLERLRQAAQEVETRLREKAAQSQERIARAMKLADEVVAQRIAATTARSREILEKRYREGLELGRQKGHEEGLAVGLVEGRERGHDAARESLLAETSGIRQALGELGERLEERWRDTFEGPREEILRLIMEIAGQVVLDEVTRVPDVIERKLHVAMDRLATSERVTIELHPEDVEVARRYLDGVIDGLAHNASMELVECPDMERGGCRVVGDGSSVDLTSETQLEILEARLRETAGGES